MAYSNPGRQAETYAKLLRLYPKAYRQQFAEPMQQMFADMCNERAQNGQTAGDLTRKVYAETLAGALRQHAQETWIVVSTTRSKAVLGVSLIGLLAWVTIISHRPVAQAIQPGLGFRQVQQLSKGDKRACLTNNDSAAKAVRHDDGFVTYKGTLFSNFEAAAGSAIADVPAGTNYELTISSYSDAIVRGTMTYAHGYGTYNYTISKLPAAGQWELASMVACKKP